MINLKNNIYEINNIFKNFKHNYDKIVYLLFGDNKYKIIIQINDSYSEVREKLLSCLKSNVKGLYRAPYPGEVITRLSPKEKLDYLIDRGVFEDYPNIELIKRGRQKIIYNDSDIKKIENGDKIKLSIPLRGGGGGHFFEFADVDKLSETKNLNCSKNAPKYRKVSKGLNLFGKCINRKCEALGKEVVHIVGINEKFDMNLRSKEIKCPICSKNFIPLTIGFWKCEYQIKGEKLKDGEYIEININGKETKGNNFEYYDTNENGLHFSQNL